MDVYQAYRGFSEWFWDPVVWLPPNITWTDLKDTDEVEYAKFGDIYLALPLGMLFCVVRLLLERYVFSPVGMSFGLRYSKPKKAPMNGVLEKAFKANGRTGYKTVQGLAKQLDWSDRQVERWFRLRRQQNRPCTLKKFGESAWRFLYYVLSFTCGIVFLWDKSWLWDSSQCWYGYPHHTMTPGMWWYYMLQSAFYWSLIVFQFFDTKRKDFWQMFVHHIVALLLMVFSWACNMTRVGTLVLLIHDFADIFLEAAKMAKYANRQRLCDALFGFFTLSWFITRLGLYPYKVIYPSILVAPIVFGNLPNCDTIWSSLRVVYSTMYEAPTILPMFSAYYIFNSLLIILQLLHVIWSFMIVRIALNALVAGKMEKDMRSDDSNESADEPVVSDCEYSDNNKKKPMGN